MSRVRVLVTGFRPFPGAPLNPSQTVVEALKARNWKPSSQCEMRYEILDTRYREIREKLRAILTSFKPDIVIQFGLAAKTRGFRLEQSAKNRLASDRPDAAGQRVPQGPIVPDGRDRFESTMPLNNIEQALRQKGLPVERSDDAGGYVCNFSMYTVLETLSKQLPHSMAGFVHIPYTKGQRRALARQDECFSQLDALSGRDLLRGAKQIIRTTVEAFAEKHRQKP